MIKERSRWRNLELWIRTQDKKSLLKVNNIWIDTTGMTDQGYVSIMANADFSFELGNYKTKERAFQILDEIQDKMFDWISCNHHDRFHSILYEMPKE